MRGQNIFFFFFIEVEAMNFQIRVDVVRTAQQKNSWFPETNWPFEPKDWVTTSPYYPHHRLEGRIFSKIHVYLIWGTLLHPLDNLKKALIKHFYFSFFCFVNCRCRISTWWYAKEYFSDERAGSSLSGFVSNIRFGPDDLNTCVLSFPQFLNFLDIKVLCFQCFREA